MADADIRWLQRLENDKRSLATHERALSRAVTRPLGELDQLGGIQQEENPQLGRMTSQAIVLSLKRVFALEKAA